MCWNSDLLCAMYPGFYFPILKTHDGRRIHYYYYYYYYTILMSLVTGLFFLVLLLNQRWSPLIRLQASHCSTFRITCDVPSIAVFCSESIECFLVQFPNFFLSFSLLFQWLQLLLVQSCISGSTFVVSYYYYYYYYYYAVNKHVNKQEL